MADVFISYSRRDKDFVTRLHDALRGRGKDAWVDWEDIPPSAEWFREIQDGIDGSDAFLLVLSPDSVASEVCGSELDHAIERRKRVVPILHRDVDPAQVRPEAAALNWILLRANDAFDAGVEALVVALETDLEHARAHTRVGAAAIDWERHGRDRARLLRGSELVEAERWLAAAAGKQPAPTPLQGEFVQASREASRRRARALFAGVATALVVAVALAIVAVIQRSEAVHQRDLAFARQLDAQAQNHYDSDPELSVLLASKAAQVAPGSATEEQLRQGLALSHVRERYPTPGPGGVSRTIWSPRGDRLLVADGDGNARIYRPGTSAKPVVLPAPGLTEQVGWDRTGSLAITGGAQPAVWNGVTGARVLTLSGPGATAAALAPSGHRAVTIDAHGAGHIVAVPDGRRLGGWRPNGDVPAPTCFAWSPSGGTIAQCAVRARGGATVPVLRLRDARTGAQRIALHPPGLITAVAFSPDGRRIVVASIGSTPTSRGAFVYDVRSGRTVASFPETATAADFSPDGTHIAYATLSGLGHVYDLVHHTDRPLVGHTAAIKTISFSHFGEYVVTGSEDDTARVYDASSGEQLELLAGSAGRIVDAGFNADDTRVATASDDGTARVWESPTPQPARTAAPLGHGTTRASVFAPGGGALAVAGPGPGGEVLDPVTLRPRVVLAAPAAGPLATVSFSPDGRWVAGLAGAGDTLGQLPSHAAAVYDAHSGRATATLTPSAAGVVAVVALPGARVVTLGALGEVDTWNAANGHHVDQLAGAGTGSGGTLAASPDGATVAATHLDGTIALYDVRSGRRLRVLHGPRPQSQIPGGHPFYAPQAAAFSPDGRTLATAGALPGRVLLWNLQTGRPRLEVRAGTTQFGSVAFSPDGSMLVAGDAASAHEWRLPSGSHVRELSHASPSAYGFSGGAFGVRVAFSRDGRTLLTTGDISVKTWEAGTGQQLFANRFASLGALSPDAHAIAALSGGRVRRYACDLCGGLQELLSTARRETTRGLTPAERATYLHAG